jgi:hypothetical protein
LNKMTVPNRSAFTKQKGGGSSMVGNSFGGERSPANPPKNLVLGKRLAFR